MSIVTRCMPGKSNAILKKIPSSNFHGVNNNTRGSTNYLRCSKFYSSTGSSDSKSWIKREKPGIVKPFSTINHGWKRNYTFIHDPSYIHSANDPDHSKKTEDVLFEMFKDEEKDIIHVGKFLAALRNTGLRKNDPRLADFMENLKNVHRKSGMEGGSPETQKLDLDTFRHSIFNLILISKAFRHNFIIPDFQNFCKYIEEFYWKCKSNTEGKVASYIPQLARMNPDYWGVSVCTIDGQRFSIGDVTVPFTLQSCSKPLTYGIALEQLGQDVVHGYVGQEPSGRNFNELVLDYNIYVVNVLRLAGGEYLGFNNSVFLSERESADRNYALGFYMRENKCYPEKTNLKECMDFYFQCCAMEANCESMSVMAATLANGGICPITEEKVLRPDSIRDVLSLMHSCGMYDYSGQFAFKVGLPAKSGVCGGMLVVIPNTMGICSWSPPLDHMGNSCRGVQFCEELVRVFNFHRYDNLKHATNKLDPRRHKYETKGLSIVNLLFSAASGDLSAMRRHRLSGMDMTLADYDGRTALHLAAAEGHLDIVTFLLEQCAVPHHPKDRWGNSPLDEAMRFRHVQVVTYLKEWAKQQPPPGLDESSSCEPPRPVEETSPLPS
ncbi:glutaminase liver isoform, mitochondrial [Nilaparvata lugens]|uniref:glutaminase liver isoform, mitochondrial n=1 Tax=Nilaparvata lugens TaxID=108931 RepID=UPI00193DD9F2|nr:glutaminase liver isoform, mitochondrial [Nilaparvata lugens]